MIKLKADHVVRILNIGLRLSSLAAKLLLTLYMGRYLTLADMGLYGLVNGIVIILTTVLNLRLDYVVTRELVGAPPSTAIKKMRDQAVFCGLNLAILAVVMAVMTATAMTDTSAKIMLVIFVLSASESFANMTYSNINSMGKPLTAGVLFFIRSGLWVFPAAGLGFFVPAFRSSDVLFIFWAGAVAISLIATLWTWRHMPWRKAIKAPVDWDWLKKSIARCLFIGLGSLGLTAGTYVDRFIVADKLNLDMAGVVTFYSSFTMALYALVQSGITSFAYPRLISLYKKNDKKGFWHEVRQLAWHIAIFAGVIAVGLGVGVPLLGYLLHRPMLTDSISILWMMLLGMWIQCNALTLYYILFARHQDRAIWLGDLLFLVPTFGCNVVFVHYMGFNGVGYSAVVAGLFIFLWRGWNVISRAGAHVEDMADEPPA